MTEPRAPALRVSDLRKTYDNGVQALKGVSLDVAPGDFYALLGPNGAGKSTLIGIVSSLVNKTAGTVRVSGIDLDADRDAAMRQIGLVPQEPFLLAANARENIDMGRGLPQREIEAAARAAGAHEFIAKMPERNQNTNAERGVSPHQSGHWRAQARHP